MEIPATTQQAAAQAARPDFAWVDAGCEAIVPAATDNHTPRHLLALWPLAHGSDRIGALLGLSSGNREPSTEITMRGGVLSCLAAALWMAGSALAADRPLVQPLEPDPETATSAAVLVGPCALAHTAQILPLDTAGRLVAPQDAAQQVRQVLSNLERILLAADSGLDDLVRVHVAVAKPEILAEVQREFRRRFPPHVRPAATWIVGALPQPGALVMLDAVAAVPEHNGTAVSHHRATDVWAADGRSHVSVLPRGRTVYVSGQAESGATLQDATRQTLASLSATLEHLGLNRSHVVHVRSFLQPVSRVAEADREIAAFFQGVSVPATVHVEWTMRSPIEIELVAWAPEGTVPQATDRLSVITPPGLQASPVFARVVAIHSNRVLYTSGLSTATSDNAEQDVRRVLHRLDELLTTSGSDFEHLAKATYYVTGDEISRALNTVRPDYYDPHRPPAASKAEVRGAGGPDRRLSIDMIAIPAEHAESADAVATTLLDDAHDPAARAELINQHPHRSAALLQALVADLEPGTPEEYRRIPWIWRVTIAAGRRNRAPEIRRLLDRSLPPPGEPLHDWQAVVVGGGIINGLSQSGEWPRERIAELLDQGSELHQRWERAINLAAVMADSESVPHGTRYDALRMLGADTWDRRGEQLSEYLASGVPDELQMGAVSGLADIRDPRAVAALLSAVGHYSERNRNLALDGLLREESRISALLDAIERGLVRPGDLGEERIGVLTNTPDEALRARARRLLMPEPAR